MLDKISQHLTKLQAELFPFLENNLGKISDKHREIIEAIDLIKLHRFLPVNYRGVGRPLEDRFSITNAFLAKAILGLSKTTDLIDRLRVDKVLRHICGWPMGSKLPSESTFSRVFAELSKNGTLNTAHEIFINESLQGRLVFNLSRDSTALEAREKGIRTEPARKCKGKRGRPKKGEETKTVKENKLEKQAMMGLTEMMSNLKCHCDFGTKKNSKGFKTSWKGYKLHIDTTDTGIPVAAILTSASVHDSQVALPLARISGSRVTYLYELMDSAYDAKVIREDSKNRGHVALIDFNNRGATLEKRRYFTPCEKERYKSRSGAERANSELKDNYGAALIMVKGHAKVFCHLMFALIALSAKQIINLSTA